MKVIFHNLEEFKQEIRDDAEYIDRGIVRIVQTYISDKSIQMLWHAHLTASYTIPVDPESPTDKTRLIVKLDCYYGNFMKGAEQKALIELNQDQQKLEQFITAYPFLSIRSGSIKTGGE